VKLLGAQVDVAIAADDLDAARAACDELEAIAGASSMSVLDGAATMARGALCLAEGDATSALESLRKACATYPELKLPYETAQARMHYGLAVRAAGAEDDAMIELRAALTGFERLGAEPDAAKASAHLAGPGALPRGLTVREAEVLRLVAAGKSNRAIAAELVISEHTVARHLQNIFAKLEVPSRSAATAFAFEHGLA
jgi:DNA-binding NarL/FixJ family response regulator